MRRMIALGTMTVLVMVLAPRAGADSFMILNTAPGAGISGTFTGTVDGVAFTATATDFGAPETNTDGTATMYSGLPGTFTPLLAQSYSLGFYSEFGFTINFASPVTNVTFDIFSLVNDLTFNAPVTLISAGGNNFPGGPGVGITVSGDTVMGQASGNGGDANGTFTLAGTFTTITAIPIVKQSDGVAITFSAQSVPEPSSLVLAGVSLSMGCLVLLRRCRRSIARA